MIKKKNCSIANNAVLNAIELDNYVTIFENVRIQNSKIGSYSYIQKFSQINNATIGSFCSIGSNVSIAPGIHKMDGVSTHPAFYSKSAPLPKVFCDNDDFATFKRVIIGNDVWIGDKVIILDGITIGTGVVIAAGAVVTKDIVPYSIVGGVPAKHIKYRFDTETIDILLNSEWWNNTEQWFELNYKSITNTVEFKDNLKNKLT